MQKIGNKNRLTTHFLAFSCRNWAFCILAMFWATLFIVNAFNLAPGVRFRGIRFLGADFDQYYGAGVGAACGLWDELYPDPSKYVKGRRPAEAPYRPKLAAELLGRGASVQTKNIYPPPTSLLFSPLAVWKFRPARLVFTAFLCVCIAAFLHLLYKECLFFGLSRRQGGLLVLLAGTGLPMVESVMLANATPIIGLCALLALRGIRQDRIFPVLSGFAVSGLVKGFSAVWAPALFVWKRWKLLAAGLVAAGLFLGFAFLCGCGLDAWREYVFEVLPVSRGNLYRIGDSNLGFPSFFAWLCGWRQTPRNVANLFSAVQLGLIGTAYALAWAASRDKKNVPVAQGLSLFVSTIVFQTFSTVCWPHYAVNVLPFFPVAAAAATKRRASLAVFVFGFALIWFPIGNAAKYILDVSVLGFGRFFGYVILLAWSIAELAGMCRFHPVPFREKELLS